MTNRPIETIKKNGFRIEIYHDLAPENPREWDNLGKMVCFHRRYDLLGDRHSYGSPEELTEAIDSGKYFYLPLYLYDHSGLRMSTSPFSCPWDSGQVGFILVEKERARKEAPKGENVEKWALKMLEAEVGVYDQYLIGDVFGWVLFDNFGIEVDSCWGYFGLEAVRREAEAVLSEYVAEWEKTVKEKRRSAIEWLTRAGLFASKKMGDAVEFLEGVDASGEIEYFKAKIRNDGFLRAAVLSHLRHLFKLGREDAGAIVDLFIWKEGVSNG